MNQHAVLYPKLIFHDLFYGVSWRGILWAVNTISVQLYTILQTSRPGGYARFLDYDTE